MAKRKTMIDEPYPKNVQYLRERVAELPRLLDERSELLAEIESRKQRIADGQITEKALEKPQRELGSVTYSINLIHNDYPQQIVNSLTGERLKQWQTLRKRVSIAQAALNPELQAIEKMRTRVAEMESRLKHGTSELAPVDQFDSDDVNRHKSAREEQREEKRRQIERLKAEIDEARELSRDSQQRLKDARDALSEFKQEVVYGLLQESEADE